MMSCPSGFTITKGLDNTFVFTVKANGTTLPMEIKGTDTFTAYLYPIDPDNSDTPVLTKKLTVTDALNGKISLVISSADTIPLEKDFGDKVDRYYKRPVYKLVLDCRTANNGDFLVKVSEVYVD